MVWPALYNPLGWFAQSADAPGGGQPGERIRAGFRGTAEVLVTVNGDQPELRPVPFGPFEVVKGRPMQVAAHVDTLGAGLGEGGEVRLEVGETFVVVLGGNTVFGDVEGQPGSSG